jgi:hypothetical protein
MAQTAAAVRLAQFGKTGVELNQTEPKRNVTPHKKGTRARPIFLFIMIDAVRWVCKYKGISTFVPSVVWRVALTS